MEFRSELYQKQPGQSPRWQGLWQIRWVTMTVFPVLVGPSDSIDNRLSGVGIATLQSIGQ